MNATKHHEIIDRITDVFFGGLLLTAGGITVTGLVLMM